MANWAELDEDPLSLIANRLNLFQDFVAFGGVCTSWRSVMAEVKKIFNTSLQIPWLMLAEYDDSNDNGYFRNIYSSKVVNCDDSNNSILRDFYSLKEGKFQLKLPEASGKRCFSSQGWLLTISKEEEVSLLHPLLRVQIQLPNLSTFSDLKKIITDEMYVNFIAKVVLSSSPCTTSDFAVMVIHGRLSKLAFYKPGDHAWTTIKTKFAAYLDVIYYKGQFYAVDCEGRVVVCDINGPSPTIAKIVSVMPTGLVPSTEKLYLVESLGKLLIVSRDRIYLDPEEEDSDFDDRYGTLGFQVLELNVINGKWEKVQSLGNRALFVGFSSSFSVEAVDITGCKPNCIYFTDDWIECYTYGSPYGGGNDMGIYHLADGTIESHFREDSFSFISPPLWVTPSF